MAIREAGGERICGVRGGGSGDGPGDGRGSARGAGPEGARSFARGGGPEGARCSARGGVRRIVRGVRAGTDTGAPSRRVIRPV